MAAISTLKVRTVLMLTLSLKMITGLPQQQTIHLLLARRPLSLVTGDFRYSHYHHFRARYFSMGSSESATEVITTLEEGPHMAETEIKKSRFIGYAKNVDNWEDAKSYISQVKEEHPKARHWCYGFQCGTNPVHERSSDDGEPSGTAGAPILGAIKGEEISDVVCVVVRYFGGVKLGAGGLIRAYGGAARLVLREAPKVTSQPKSTFKLTVDASYVGAIYEALSKAQALPSGEEYRADGSFAVSVTCDQAIADELKESIKDATKGTVEYNMDLS